MAKIGTKRLDPERSAEVIQSLGGTSEVARLFGISAPSVTAWKKSGIPDYRLLVLQIKFKKNPAVRKTLNFNPCELAHRGCYEWQGNGLV